MEKSRVYIRACATGRTSFWKKKAPMAIATISTVSGFITLMSDIPEAFIAVSSKFSPRLPKVMSDARSMANGSARGTIVRAA